MSTDADEKKWQKLPDAVVASARKAQQTIADQIDEAYRKPDRGVSLADRVSASSVESNSERSLLTKLIFGASEKTSVIDGSNVFLVVNRAINTFEQPISILSWLTNGFTTPNEAVETITKMFKSEDLIIKDLVTTHREDLEMVMAAAKDAEGRTLWEKFAGSNTSSKSSGANRPKQ